MLKTIFLLLLTFLFSLQLHTQNSTIPAEVSVVRSFGSWETSEQSGYYLIVLKQFGYQHVKNNVFIQWIAESKYGTYVVQSVSISEVNEPNIYAIGIEEIDGKQIKLNLTDTYTLQDSSIKISVCLPGKYKVSAL